MGRFKKNRRKGSKAKETAQGERRQYVPFEQLRRDNANFRKYYTAQNLVAAEEFPELIESMRTVLPTNFRITGSRSQSADIRNQLVNEFVPLIKSTLVDGEEIEPPHELAWYPSGLGWQFVIPRIALKRSKELGKFHSFLVTETEVGNISRQEAVSMVPPLLMDIEPDHFVLDMCAAPGSKTAQLVEALHARGAASGLVVANDADYKRSCMLVHQINRLASPNVVITNHGGERFPNVTIDGSPLQFDRILCDVPCSGDGTTRKNVRIWERWRPDDAHSLNPVQTKILMRAAYLLKTGGRIVYSTCSLNPVENEAVVAHVLEHFEGALQLVDVSDRLPALKRRAGLKTWKVMTRDGELHEAHEAIPAGEHGRNRRKYSQQLFALPGDRMDELHIERCMRIYSHMQNTGGFFVAVLEKVKPISVDEKRKAREKAAAEAASAEPSTSKRPLAEDSEDAEPSTSKRERVSAPSDSEAVSDKAFLPDQPRADPALLENPFVFLDGGSGELHSILSFYGIRESMNRRGFLTRIEKGSFRSVYYVSDSVRALMEAAKQRLRVVNTGIRVFGRNSVKDANCAYRLVCEGVNQVLPHLADKYVVDVGFSDLRVLLDKVNPLFDELSPATKAKLEAVDAMSSVVVRFEPGAQPETDDKPYTRLTATLAIPCWRGHASLSVHVDKNQLRSLRLRVLGEHTEKTDTASVSNNGKSTRPEGAEDEPATGQE